MSDATPAKKPRLWRPRFSLRTLLIVVLLAGSGFGLWWRWEPWALDLELKGTISDLKPKTSFSPNGSHILTVGAERKGRLWDAQTGKLLFTFGENFERTRFTPDGLRIISHPIDDTVSIWNAQSGEKIAQVQEWGNYYDLDCSPDGKTFLTKTVFLAGSYTRGAELWETNSGKLIREFANEEYVSIVRFSPDGNKTLTVCGRSHQNQNSQESVLIWDVATGEELAALRGFQDDVHFASFLPDGKRLLTATIFELSLWDATTGMEIASCKAPIRKAVLSPCGRRLLAMESPAYGTVNMRLWDVEALTRIGSLEWETGRVSGSIEEAAFSPDGASLIIDKHESIWSGTDGSVLCKLPHALSRPHAASFGPTGSRIVSTDKDGVTHVWKRRRPEWWWGVAWLPEFWLSLIFGAGLLWSLVRDFRTLRKAPA